MSDPTYVKAEIDADPVWRLAFRLSEVDNDNAPIGWHRYMPIARWILETFEAEQRERIKSAIGDMLRTLMGAAAAQPYLTHLERAIDEGRLMSERHRFIAEQAVTPELLRDADHTKHDIWTFAAPLDAVRSSVKIDKLFVPTSPEEQRFEHAIVVRVHGTSERKRKLLSRRP